MSRPPLMPAPRRCLVMATLSLLVAARPCPAEPPPTAAPLRMMVLAPQWEQAAEQLAVQDRGPWAQSGLGPSTAEAFRLGSHAVTAVRRSAISTQRLALGPLERLTHQWTLSYGFHGAMDWEGRCDWRSKTLLTHRIGLLPDAVTTLHCVCSQGQRKAAFSISDEWRPAGGDLLIDGRTLQLHLQDVAGHEVNLASTAPAFLVRGEEDQLLAAVDTFRPGRVWRHRGLPADATEPMACLASALLLSYPN
ncbi:hypothetical protein ACS5PK_21595 [Roseateles sp. DB2]|uniref:hypothetical protein n=1 Tax=Roseateles sp. DB2 TaxID=3453717 RepID=UPI003EEBCC58